jgi:hypothetical protein
MMAALISAATCGVVGYVVHRLVTQPLARYGGEGREKARVKKEARLLDTLRLNQPCPGCGRDVPSGEVCDHGVK